ETEIDEEWGSGPIVRSGYMSDYDWLSIGVTYAVPKFRFRTKNIKGNWMSWQYVYSPMFLVTPEEFS
ncbi:hypothetical protein LCGC14_2957050, partial [marine sediment metagenome]